MNEKKFELGSLLVFPKTGWMWLVIRVNEENGDVLCVTFGSKMVRQVHFNKNFKYEHIIDGAIILRTQYFTAS